VLLSLLHSGIQDCASFSSSLWDNLLGVSVKVENFRSILRLDPSCMFSSPSPCKSFHAFLIDDPLSLCRTFINIPIIVHVVFLRSHLSFPRVLFLLRIHSTHFSVLL
jgi:hypothetical protein